MKICLLVTSLATCLGLSTACKKNDDKKTTNGDGGTVTTEFQPSRLALSQLRQAMTLLGSNGPALTADETLVGQATGANLESMKFRLQRVELCSEMAQGSCASGPWSIFSESNASNYDTFTSKEAAADDTGYIDFMNKDSLASLGTNTVYNEGHVGSYKTALVFWYRPFKIKASVPMLDGQTTLYTKSSTDFRSNGASGLDVTYETTVSGITTAPAEEGVFFLPNGGTYVHLQKPFEITEADIENKVPFKIVMAFDPDDLIKGIQRGPRTDNFLTGMADPDAGFRIEAPFLQVAPVVARENEKIMRETYLLRSTSGHAIAHDVRLSLYYIEEDEEKSVRAVTSTVVYNSATSSPWDAFPQTSSITANEDGTINLLDWGGFKILGSFKRMTATGTIDNVVAEICNGSPQDGQCSGEIINGNYTYTLISIGEVEGQMTAEPVELPEPTEPTE